MSGSAVVAAGTLQNARTKCVALTLDRADWAALDEMHGEASRKIPGLHVEQTVSAVLTEAVRMWRAGRAGERTSDGKAEAVPG